MSEKVWLRNFHGGKTYFTRYTRDEIVAAWNDENGQGNKYARDRGLFCFVKECGEKDAVILSALFVRKVFAEPASSHYDGRTLSLYCGGAGGNAAVGIFDSDPNRQTTVAGLKRSRRTWPLRRLL